MVSINIKEDIQEVKQALIGLLGDRKKAEKRILTSVAAGARRRILKNYKRHLGIKSGELKQAIYYKAKDGFALISVWSRRQYKAQTHEFGKIIHPRDHKHLVFQINGQVKKCATVNIKPRPFLENEAEAFMKSPDLQKTLDGAIDREINRIWKKK